MPARIESTLLVVGAFRDASGFEYRPGDRASLARRAVRRAALAHPELFVMEFETAPVDVDWLRELDLEHDRRFRAEMRRRDEAKVVREKALRDELREQDRPQPELERRYKRQEAERKEREQERRQELERRQVEQELAVSNRPRHGFH